MVELLMIADDFTGALDTGVQFTARGAATSVVTVPACDFTAVKSDTQVLVLNAETRHLSPEAAYETVFEIVRKALDAGIPYIYKKTDSALRGNVGSELTAVMDAAGTDRIPFLPAFPKMGRITRNGIHYIDGVPVAESVFGQDLFEPVCRSDVAGIIQTQARHPVVLCKDDADCPAGIRVFDAATDADLVRIGTRLGPEGLKISAGCAGFAAVLADILSLEGPPPELRSLPPAFFVACGSVNPVTLQQMHIAEKQGFPHIRLAPVQKLEAGWIHSDECRRLERKLLELTRKMGRCILDVNDPDGSQETALYAKRHQLTREEMRLRISGNLAALMQRLLDSGLDATLLCTGGDTLLALMRQVGVAELIPVCEVEPGAVLTQFTYHGKTYHIISKSGGFGESDLLCRLASKVSAGIQEEYSC